MKNILIVDDEAGIRQILSRYIERGGYACWKAENVKQAREMLANNPIDLIISDINMPGESGIDLTRFIKEQYPHIPVVIASVIDSQNVAKEVLDLDIYGYIVKPFTRGMVLITIENALRRSELESQSKRYQNVLEDKVQQQTAKIESQLVFTQNLMDTIPCAVYYLNALGILCGCNQVFEEFVGKAKSKIVGKNIEELSLQLSAFDSLKSGGNFWENNGQEIEISVPDAEGNSRDFLIRKAIHLDEKGRLEGIVGIMMDITDNKNITRALQASEEKYRNIVNNISVGVALIGRQFEIIQYNPQLQEWFPGLRPGIDIPCYKAFQCPPQDSPCEDCPVCRTFSEGKSFDSIVRIEGKQGDRYFKDHSSPIWDENGNISAAILLVEDVTEHLIMERELRQTQKLEAIGQLAAGIAHEINTPIQYIGDNNGFLKESFGDLAEVFSIYDKLLQSAKDNNLSDSCIGDVEKQLADKDISYLLEEIPRAIEESLEGVQRVTGIVRAMRDFSHPGTDKKIMVNLNSAIENTITVSRNEWKYVSEMELDLDASLPGVSCFAGEINQVLLNIIINAAHAIKDAVDPQKPEMGKIRISTRKKLDFVEVRISDTGTGIPPNIQNRIFDPFFTTKTVGKGTGQGLAIAHRVITEKHNGFLRFETSHNKGTTFIISLPLSNGAQ